MAELHMAGHLSKICLVCLSKNAFSWFSAPPSFLRLSQPRRLFYTFFIFAVVRQLVSGVLSDNVPQAVCDLGYS